MKNELTYIVFFIVDLAKLSISWTLFVKLLESFRKLKSSNNIVLLFVCMGVYALYTAHHFAVHVFYIKTCTCK